MRFKLKTTKRKKKKLTKVSKLEKGLVKGLKEALAYEKNSAELKRASKELSVVVDSLDSTTKVNQNLTPSIEVRTLNEDSADSRFRKACVGEFKPAQAKEIFSHPNEPHWLEIIRYVKSKLGADYAIGFEYAKDKLIQWDKSRDSIISRQSDAIGKLTKHKIKLDNYSCLPKWRKFLINWLSLGLFDK
jgi:hypothetical protein